MEVADYASCLTSWEKQIEHGWYKRQSQLKKQVSKRKSQRGGGGGASSGSGSDTSTMPAAAGSSSSSSKTIPGAVANTSAGAEAALAAAAGTSSSASASGANTPNPHSAADNPSHTLGLPPLPENLVTALQKRAELKRAFEPMFAKMQYANRNPLPHDSVFADLSCDEEDEEGME